MTVTKYSANGNDFVMFIAQKNEDRTELAKTLCHRQNGIGADGLVVLIPHDDYDFEWEFYNSDGSQADMCAMPAEPWHIMRMKKVSRKMEKQSF